jgi:hypothetical protein
MKIVRTMEPVSFCSGVCSCSTAARAVPILPISDPAPVAFTIATPWPWTMRVPEYTKGVSSPPGRCRASPASPAALRTGTDSPVRRDSSADRLTPQRTTASAGTLSPSASIMRSPVTTSRPAILRLSPSRMTRARGLDRSRSASSVFSVFCSW